MNVTTLSNAQACVKTTYDEQLQAEINARRNRTAKHPDSQHAVKIPPRFGVTPQVCMYEVRKEGMQILLSNSQAGHGLEETSQSQNHKQAFCRSL